MTLGKGVKVTAAERLGHFPASAGSAARGTKPQEASLLSRLQIGAAPFPSPLPTAEPVDEPTGRQAMRWRCRRGE
jgi:hypothetical protein